MRWRALQTGRVYVKQHPGDAQLSLDELQDMVGREGQTFSNRVSTVSEYQNFPNSYLLFTKVSMHLSISHSLCSAVHNYDSLCRRSSRSPIMLSILLVINVIVIRWRRVVYGLYTSGFVFIGHEGVARVVYQNGSHECITRKPQATPSYNWLI